MEDVFFNTMVAQAADMMADIIAQLLGLGEPAPSSYDKWVALGGKVRAAIASTLWSEELGMYASRDQRTGQLLPVRTIGGLAPLMLHAIPAVAQATPSTDLRRGQLVEMLRSPRFALPFPVPSNAADASTFDGQLYWRGPTWFNMDWLLLRTPAAGLERCIRVLHPHLCAHLRWLSCPGYRVRAGCPRLGVGR